MGELADYLAANDANFRKARLPALYSDFRPQRTLNPDGYRANITAWQSALSLLSSKSLLPSSSPLILSVDKSLLRNLESRQYGQPLALGTAIREGIQGREIYPLNDFLKQGQSVYHHGWGEVPWNVAGWTLRTLGIVDPSRGEDRLPTGQYVLVQNLEAAARELKSALAAGSSVFDRVFTKAQFRNQFASKLVPGHRLDEKDVDVILRFLARDTNAIEYDGSIIRVKGQSQEGPITEQDASVASLKELMGRLEHQVTILNERIAALELTAKEAVGRKNRVQALAALKSKKLAESSLSTRYATLHQLEEVAHKIQQASDNAALVNVMESSADVLEGLNKQVGGVERVDAAMDKIRDASSEADEVAAILAEGGQAVDEAGIDDELDAMMSEEKNKEDEKQRQAKERQQREADKEEEDRVKQRLEDLPDVPREREKTPTSETGLANLSMADKEAPMGN